MANTSHPLSSNLIYSLIGSSSGHLNFTDEKDKALRGYANLSCVLQSRKESDPDPCQQTSCLAAYKVLLGMEFSSLTSPWVFLQSPCPHSLLPCHSHHLLKLTMAIRVDAWLSVSWLQPSTLLLIILSFPLLCALLRNLRWDGPESLPIYPFEPIPNHNTAGDAEMMHTDMSSEPTAQREPHDNCHCEPGVLYFTGEI
jgi:hypothetical protein